MRLADAWLVGVRWIFFRGECDHSWRHRLRLVGGVQRSKHTSGSYAGKDHRCDLSAHTRHPSQSQIDLIYQEAGLVVITVVSPIDLIPGLTAG